MMTLQREALNLEVPRNMDPSPRPLELATRKLNDDGGPPAKRLATEEDRLLAHAGMPSAHIKITSRGQFSQNTGISIDSSLNSSNIAQVHLLARLQIIGNLINDQLLCRNYYPPGQNYSCGYFLQKMCK